MIISNKQAEESFDRGMNYFRAGFYSNALNEFKQLKKIAPDYPNIDYIIEASAKRSSEIAGKISNFIEENFDEEIQTLSEDLTYENSSCLGPEIQSLLKHGKYNEALNKLEKAEAVVPDSRPLLLLMGNTMRRLGMLKDAEKVLLRAKNIYPDDSEILNDLGNVYLGLCMYREAEELFMAALKLSDNDPRILNNLGALRIQTNNLDDAERLFRQAMKLKPNWRVLKSNLSRLNARIEALENEIEQLRNEFLVHPTYLDIGLALGKALFFRGYFSEARSTFKRVLKKNGNLIAAHFYLASIAEITCDIEKAIQHYSEVAIRSGKNETPEYLNFETLVKQGLYEEALEELKKIAILDIDMAASRINLGISYFENCDWKNALRHFEEAIRINDTYPDAFYWAALTYIQLGKTSVARSLLQRALKLNPNYADAHFQLGMLIRARSKKKAFEHLTKALSLNLRPSSARMARQILDS